jgi:hypothetical protein
MLLFEDGAVERAVDAAGSGFCLISSAFCVVYCLFLAWLISIDYECAPNLVNALYHLNCHCVLAHLRFGPLSALFSCSYLGEWKATGLIPASDGEKKDSAMNCYIVAGVYGAFTLISAGALFYHRGRK